jgi:hypothetical protein
MSAAIMHAGSRAGESCQPRPLSFLFNTVSVKPSSLPQWFNLSAHAILHPRFSDVALGLGSGTIDRRPAHAGFPLKKRATGVRNSLKGLRSEHHQPLNQKVFSDYEYRVILMYGPSWILMLKESFSARCIYSGCMLPLACASFHVLAVSRPSSETSTRVSDRITTTRSMPHFAVHSECWCQ